MNLGTQKFPSLGSNNIFEYRVDEHEIMSLPRIAKRLFNMLLDTFKSEVTVVVGGEFKNLLGILPVRLLEIF